MKTKKIWLKSWQHGLHYCHWSNNSTDCNEETNYPIILKYLINNKNQHLIHKSQDIDVVAVISTSVYYVFQEALFSLISTQDYEKQLLLLLISLKSPSSASASFSSISASLITSVRCNKYKLILHCLFSGTGTYRFSTWQTFEISKFIPFQFF